uniref:Uncharacterized protein n=1 Tax=Arundo donax TaxID=35708 RepID=A0A0A9APP9_ARUDO
MQSPSPVTSSLTIAQVFGTVITIITHVFGTFIAIITHVFGTVITIFIFL